VEEEGQDCAAQFARAIFNSYYAGAIWLQDVPALLQVVSELGAEAPAAAERIADPAFNQFVRQIGEDAVTDGIFRSPWVIADEEPFWGWDRLPLLDQWLRRGGW